MSKKEDIALRKKIAEALVKARKIVAAHKAEYHGVYFSSGGGGTTQSNTTSTVPASVLAEYNQVTGQANNVASAPLNQYGGQIVAGTTPTEQSAYNTINNLQGETGPVTSSQIQQYESPYTQNVLNTTMAAENNQDAQQQAQLQGNAISAGAWGGDRSGVAQGILGGQQALANNATNAGIENTGFLSAEQEANTQQQNVFNNTLLGANAQLGSGQAQQQQAQSELNVPYEQFLQQQAYPFQTTGWLGNIAEGIGSNEGGSSTSSTTQPSEGLFGLKRGGGILKGDGNIRYYRHGGGIVPRKLASGGDSGSWTGGNGQTYDTSDFPSLGLHAVGNNVIGELGNIMGTIATGVSSAVPASTGNGSFTAQTAPTYAQFASSPAASSGTPYTGGAVAGLSSANQADLNAIYGKSRGGIVHRDDGGAMPEQQQTDALNTPLSNNASRGIIQRLQSVPQRLRLQQLQQEAPYGTGTSAAIANPTGYGMARGGIAPRHFGDDTDGGIGGATVPPDTATGWDSVPPPGDDGMGGILNMASNNAGSGIVPSTSSEDSTSPPPTPPVNASDHPANMGYEAEMPQTHQANPWLAVASGVLGTLAGRSRNPLVDIGQGGLIGINNYAQQQKAADEENYTQGSFHQNAQKLSDEAQQHKDAFAQEKLRDANQNSIAQQNADTNSAYRQDQSANMKAERQKPQMVKDVMGNDIGWAIPGQSKIIPLTGQSGYMNPAGDNGNSSASSAALPSSQPSSVYGPVAPAIGSGSVGQRLNSKLLAPFTTAENIDSALGKYPPAVVTHAEMLASGEEPWPTGFVAAKSPIYGAASNLARQINPSITAASYPTFLDFAKGPSSNIVKSLDVAIPHLDTLSGLADALDNGDTKLLNSVGNKVRTEFGLSDAPTNFNAAKQIVGNEVLKAVIGSGGSLADREEAAKQLNDANSVPLLKGVINTYKSLMQGQMQGLQQKYESATGRNDFQTRILGHKAQQELANTQQISVSPHAQDPLGIRQ